MLAVGCACCAVHTPQGKGHFTMRLLSSFLWAICNSVLLTGACEDNVSALRNTLACVNDYWLTIRCTLNLTAYPLHNESASYWLEFEDEDEKFKCPLVSAGDHYTCTTQAKINTATFTSMYSFTVTLYSDKIKYELMDDYSPKYHIKPNSPSNLTIHRTSEGYLFTWVSNYEHHQYLANEMEYKFMLQKKGLQNQTPPLHIREKKFYIDEKELEPDTEYIATVCTIAGYQYKGQCSEWSPAVHWKTNVTQGSRALNDLDGFKLLGQVVLPVCIVAGVLLCLFFTPKARLRIKAWSDIPTPAPYFQPLYKNYRGNFQSWLVSQGNLREPFKMEELLKIDALIEAKPLKRDEETFVAPPIHLMQCQAPYVSPGDRNWCIANGGGVIGSATEDSPPTLLSLPILKASFDEIFGSQSLDLGDAIEGDSGCEDLTHSLDSSWPKEPESVCFSEDYCTLSDSHNGLIPRVVFKPACSKVSGGPYSENSPDAHGYEVDVGAES